MKLRLLLWFAILSTAVFAQAEKDGLLLDVVTEIVDFDLGMPGKPDRHVLSIQPLLKNVGAKPITVATSTYSGEPTCFGGSKEEPLACYSIGPRIIDNRIVVEPSPIKFCSVTLEPGEWAELPKHEVELESRDDPKRVQVFYDVAKVIGLKYGWWHGELALNKAIEPQKKPNQSPEPTAMSVTPPAAQESRQP